MFCGFERKKVLFFLSIIDQIGLHSYHFITFLYRFSDVHVVLLRVLLVLVNTQYTSLETTERNSYFVIDIFSFIHMRIFQGSNT